MMKFNPLTENELQVQSLVPEGIYNYQVIKAEEKVSKAGNEYIAMNLKIWDESGKEHLVFTNLALVKLMKHFCDVNEMQDQYKTGDVPAYICQGKSGGKVILAIEPEKTNPSGGMYLSKNIVRDYISGENRVKDNIPFNDELPF